MQPVDERSGDDAIARVLQVAGERERPEASVQADVRAAVAAEWHDMLSTRRARRRKVGWAMAAGVALAAIGVSLVVPLLDRAPQRVASITIASGPVEQRLRGQSDWTPLAQGSPIAAGTELRTLANSRAALALQSGIALRLDRASRITLADHDEAALLAGAAYVDSGIGARPESAHFALRTAAGTVRHLGTQYEARIEGAGLRVAVREGRVRIDTPDGAVSGVAGEQLLLGDGRALRLVRPAHDAAWNWVGAVTPPYRIEGSTLRDFLRWAARETGRDLVFVDPETELTAGRIVLRGSVEGLSPDESILAVRATTDLAIELAVTRIEVLPSPL